MNRQCRPSARFQPRLPAAVTWRRWNEMRRTAFGSEENPAMPTKPTIARVWRGRTRRDLADAYQAYLQAEGIPPLRKTALGVQQLREDRDEETWFTTISYWADIAAMTAFTKGEPTKVHHLARDAEFLIELPERIEIHRILIDEQGLR
ncbi:hypothetical protein ABIA06_005618 [Bradyrhizobium yuanmingense]